jgi:hypothetical protein
MALKSFDGLLGHFLAYSSLSVLPLKHFKPFFPCLHAFVLKSKQIEIFKNCEGFVSKFEDFKFFHQNLMIFSKKLGDFERFFA